jgi:nucleotide-binding universal stress UspA family protein
LRRLLYAADRSAASRAALLAVAGLAVGGQTEVVVLHVDDRGQPEEGRRLVTDIACALIALAVDARPELRQAPPGRVAAAIAAVAAEQGSNLVVLGSRGRSDLGGLLPGRVGHEVVERVPCPLLLVRAGRRASERRRRVLVAVTGDEDLAELVGITAAVAERDAQVLVLRLPAPGAGEPWPAASGVGGAPPHPDPPPPGREGVQVVEQMVTGLRRYGVRARGRVDAGAPGTTREIARAALAYGADLVVMGSRRLPALAARLDVRSAIARQDTTTSS